MAWLQNLAGKAENLLNKIDQNAANVLNDPTIKQQISLQYEEDLQVLPITSEEATEKEEDAISVISSDSELLSQAVNVFEKTFKSNHSTSSANNSEDVQKFEIKIAQLEEQNQQVISQILNLQHLYSEIKNENAVLNEQLKRANEYVAAINVEMEQYKVRAQRVLQEKEKLISYKKDVGCNDGESNNGILANYLEELKKELTFQQEKNEELNVKLQNASLELAAMQQKFFETNRIDQETIRELEEALANKCKLYLDAEEELGIKNQDIQRLTTQLAEKSQILKTIQEELQQLKIQLRQNKSLTSNGDLEERLQSLTQMLISKQSNLETVTTERNALRLQLEKLENEYHKLMSKVQQTTIKIETVNDTDDAKSQVPQFMRVSLLDAGVTRRVKRAYSTLDAFSVRTGIFLRRYPLARVFVFSYCVLLHFWVIIILFTYVPNVR